MAMISTFTIGITGGSGSGKTFFINELSSHFKSSQVCLLSQDHYYKPIHLQEIDERGVENFDLPEAIDRERLLADIQSLKKGNSVSLKEYTFNKSGVIPAMYTFRPSPILIIEGLFVQYFQEIEKELDLRIFIEAKDYLKLSRRISRDKLERGYDVHDVLYRYEHHVMPVYERLIEPLKHQADLIIPNNSNMKAALNIVADALKVQLQNSNKA
ncbi:MAG TPA: uridine kinase [Ohtaekwangia sp.]|nr:uridine kinase [Ohtaekwangia sp.]